MIDFRGRSRMFSRGRRIFKKKFKNFAEIFLGRPNWFSELFPSTKKTLFWPKFFEKQAKKAFLGTFLENFDQKNWVARSPPFKLVYRIRQPKIDFSK